MVTSKAATVDDYLAELPEDRRAVMTEVRDRIRRHLPEGYVEAMTWGMPTYEVPLARHPDTYNGKPLAYIAFAAQKNNYALYLLAVYEDGEQDRRLREAAVAMGVKLDMGKCCIRFKRMTQLPWNVIEDLIAECPVDAFIARHEAGRAAAKKR
jgi:hypothetical protein